mgnify:CR=1 FL=1
MVGPRSARAPALEGTGRDHLEGRARDRLELLEVLVAMAVVATLQLVSALSYALTSGTRLVPVMLLVVKIVNASKGWYESA